MFIKPTKEASGNIFDIHDDAAAMLIYTASEDVPCPWDADLEVVSGKVILRGNLLPGGPGAPKSMCTCECRVEDFTKFYKLEIPDDNDDLMNALADAGWERA